MRRKILSFLVLFCMTQLAFAQAPLNTINSVPIPFNNVEVKPYYPGGVNEFIKYVAKNFRTPEVEGLSGVVKVTFIVELDGSLSNIKVIKDLGNGTAEEAKRVVASSPKWVSGENGGYPVRVLFELPITIK